MEYEVPGARRRRLFNSRRMILTFLFIPLYGALLNATNYAREATHRTRLDGLGRSAFIVCWFPASLVHDRAMQNVSPPVSGPTPPDYVLNPFVYIFIVLYALQFPGYPFVVACLMTRRRLTRTRDEGAADVTLSFVSNTARLSQVKRGRGKASVNRC